MSRSYRLVSVSVSKRHDRLPVEVGSSEVVDLDLVVQMVHLYQLKFAPDMRTSIENDAFTYIPPGSPPEDSGDVDVFVRALRTATSMAASSVLLRKQSKCVVCDQ